MRKELYLTAFHKLFRINLFLIVMLVGILTSCVEDIVVYRTETKDLIGDYLQKAQLGKGNGQWEKGQFSEFNKMLDTTKVMGLLKSYGEYTCFAPTDSALKAYYKSKGRTSMDDFPLDSIKVIVYNHIIKGEIYTSDLFREGPLPVLGMNDRAISIDTFHYFVDLQHRDSTILTIVNKVPSKQYTASTIIKGDILLNNGVIHVINDVLNPTELTSIQAIAGDKKFKLFYEALQKTHLAEKILLIIDSTYIMNDWLSFNDKYGQGGGTVDQLPKSRKYGYTLLMESDETFRNKYGITDLDGLKTKAAEIYDKSFPEDAGVSDIKDPRNSLNRFIAYHMIDKALSYTKFINDYYTPFPGKRAFQLQDYDMYEYIETMCLNTLMEVRIDCKTKNNYINQVNSPEDAVQITSYRDIPTKNGYYHEIDKILAYDISVKDHMSSIRLRMDAATFFPELTNNNMRGSRKEESWIYPPGYLKGLICAKGTKFAYLNTNAGYLDFQGDEVFLRGVYDFSVVTPPIPKGTYEVRFGYQPTDYRGVAQLYFDSIPCGIPLDLRISANDDLIGWKQPGSELDDLKGYQNDKMMHNRGYMKGPSSYQASNPNSYGGLIARNSVQVLRKVLGIYKFDQPGKHVFTVSAVRDGQFMFDFLEFIPIENIENEGVD